jgi:hypothetical protein
MMIWSEADYYDVIEASDHVLLVLGDKDEQWTQETLRFLEEKEVPVNFFPWEEICELRLQLELVSYPVIQVWKAGSLKQEIVGFHLESLKKIVQFRKGQNK